MFICSKCFEKEIKWSDGSTKYQWCDDCVPRGCDCNEEIFLTELENNDWSFKENLNNLKKNILNHKISNYKLKYSDKGVSFNKDLNNYTIELSKSSFKENEKYDKLFLEENNEDFISNFTKDFNNSLKIIYLDDNKKELPCCEVMYLKDRTYIKEVNDIIFSLELNSYLVIYEIHEDGSFNCYKINDLKEAKRDNNIYSIKSLVDIEYDQYNTYHYEKTGFNYSSSSIDLIISQYEKNDEEFKILNDFLFKTLNNTILINIIEIINKDKNIENKERYINLLNEYNDDVSYYFEEYDSEHEKIEILYIQEIIKNEIIKYLESKFKKDSFCIENINELFNSFLKFHKLNNFLKFSDVLNPTVHIGCDCGCGGDTIDYNDIDYVEQEILKRKRLFVKIIDHLIYCIN